VKRSEVVNPDGSVTIVEENYSSPQLNGQLMGSISSFPVLCIANLVLCRMAMEKGEDKKIPLSKLRLLINGDDCVFPANDLTHEYWLELCPLFGMLPSVGKYYFSEKFLNINSTTYQVDPHMEEYELPELPGYKMTRCSNFRLVKFVNYGLVMGLKRSGMEMGTEDLFSQFSSFSACSEDLIESSPDDKVEEVYTAFIRRFGRLKKKINLKLPFYVPQCYGAVGLRPLGERQPSALDRAICYHFKTNPKDAPRLPKKEVNWVMHKLVMEEIPKNYEHYSEYTAYDRWYGSQVKLVFLRDSLGLGPANYSFKDNDVLQKMIAESDQKVRRCEKVWMRAEKKNGLINYNFDPWNAVPPLDPLVL
jgi:hypothetical protein